MVEELATSTAPALEAIHVSIDSLSNVVVDNQMALDYLLAEQGRVCTAANTSCCTWAPTSSQIELNMQELNIQSGYLATGG